MIHIKIHAIEQTNNLDIKELIILAIKERKKALNKE